MANAKTKKIKNTEDFPIRVSLSKYGQDENGKNTSDRRFVTFIPAGVELEKDGESLGLGKGVTPVSVEDWDELKALDPIKSRLGSTLMEV